MELRHILTPLYILLLRPLILHVHVGLLPVSLMHYFPRSLTTEKFPRFYTFLLNKLEAQHRIDTIVLFH